MNTEDARNLVLELVRHVDYDVGKSLDPEFAEDEELAEEILAECVDIVLSWVEKTKRKSC